MMRTLGTMLVFVLVLALSAAVQAQTYYGKTKLNPGDLTEIDQFGTSVAASAGRVLVGAPFQDLDDDVKGSAYSFRLLGSEWAFEYKFVASPPGVPSDRFGASVAVDSIWAAIGAPREATTAIDAGGAHIFQRNLVEWQHVARVEASDASEGALFGTALAIAGDILLVGAPRDSEAGPEAGAVYVFRRGPGDVWVQRQKIPNPTFNASDDWFGSSVTASGTTIAIGAPRADPNQMGAVHVFVPQGNSFVLESSIAAVDLRNGDQFGTSVALDGDDLAVGAVFGDDDSDTDVGAVYTFVRSLGEWFPGDKLVREGGLAQGRFGQSVALEGDLCVSGAHLEPDGSSQGAVYAFERDGMTWRDPVRIGAGDAQAGQRFGFAVTIDAETFATGAPFDDFLGQNAGAAFAFERRDCREGGVNRGNAVLTDALFVNGLTGDADRVLQVSASGPLLGTMSRPPAGGNGKYFVHANADAPTPETLAPLPSKLGAACFEVLINGGAMPVAIWNAIGKEHKIGASKYFDGSPIPDPERAPSSFLDLPSGDLTNLPPGTTITVQGAIIDPGSLSPRSASLTNAIVIEIN